MRERTKKAISLLLAASMVFAMAGCGGGADGQDAATDAANAGADAGGQAQEGGKTGEGGPVAMGRYVEEVIDLSEQASQAKDLCVREDGSLVILDREAGMLVSQDQGVTWTEDKPDWFDAVKEEAGWISDICMVSDGTVALMYYVGDSNALDPEWQMILILPDGTKVPVEAQFSDEDTYFRQVIAGDDNRIFASTHRGVYEVYRDGSAEKILTTDYVPEWIWMRDGLLFLDNTYQLEEMPAIYDLEAGEYTEDEVLVEFTADNYPDRNFNGTDYCDMYLLPGKEGTVYLAGKKGIHRHVIGGNMMEQIVDGNLSLLSNPDYRIVDMIEIGEDAFLGLFVGGKVIRFTYDPDVPTVPENMITIYSLREDDSIRQAVSLYQAKHPDVFVSYQIGMADASVTREDAIKKLNTEIMAGEGPDLLVLDELPFDSYVEKGMLSDLTDYLAEYSKKEPLFDNVVEALKRDGKAYTAPASICIPKVAAAADGMENMTDLSDLGAVVETLRKENPEKDIIAVSGERGVLKRFAGTSEPKWIKEDKTIDREVIGEYLEQCRRIFDAQMDGLDEEIKEYYEGRNDRMLELDGKKMDEMDWRMIMDDMSYVGKEIRMTSGWINSQYDYTQAISMHDNKGVEETKLVPMPGQCSHVFKPATMLAVSAASKQTDAALEFMDAFLSAELQSMYDGLPLNQNAYDIQFTPNEDYLGENGEYGSAMTTDADGNIIEFNAFWPSEEEIAALKEELSAVNTAYLPDEMLEDAVFTMGISYMRGEVTIEQALDEIEKAVRIYMAE